VLRVIEKGVGLKANVCFTQATASFGRIDRKAY
jgi:hypothetical protein